MPEIRPVVVLIIITLTRSQLVALLIATKLVEAAVILAAEWRC